MKDMFKMCLDRSYRAARSYTDAIHWNGRCSGRGGHTPAAKSNTTGNSATATTGNSTAITSALSTTSTTTSRTAHSTARSTTSLQPAPAPAPAPVPGQPPVEGVTPGSPFPISQTTLTPGETQAPGNAPGQAGQAVHQLTTTEYNPNHNITTTESWFGKPNETLNRTNGKFEIGTKNVPTRLLSICRSPLSNGLLVSAFNFFCVCS